MISHKVKVYPSKIHLSKKNQLAWKIAEISSDNAKINNYSIEISLSDEKNYAIANVIIYGYEK